MKKRVTEKRFYEFLEEYERQCSDFLTFRDDKNNFGRRVIKNSVTGENIASMQRFINQKPVCFIMA